MLFFLRLGGIETMYETRPKRRVRFSLILTAATLIVFTAGCQSELMSDDRIVSNTAGVIGVSPQDVTISDRRTDGPTNTYYIAHTRSGATYACVINGGGLLAAGITNPPTCTRK